MARVTPLPVSSPLTRLQAEHAIALQNLCLALAGPDYPQRYLQTPTDFSHVIPDLLTAHKRSLDILKYLPTFFDEAMRCTCGKCTEDVKPDAEAVRSRKRSRGTSILKAGLPQAIFNGIIKAWELMIHDDSFRIGWITVAPGRVHARLLADSRIEFQDKFDKKMEGYRFVVMDVEVDMRSATMDGRTLLGAVEGVGFYEAGGTAGTQRLVLGPGVLARRVCGVCCLVYAEHDPGTTAYVTPLMMSHEVEDGREIFALGGQDFDASGYCPCPQHAEYVKQYRGVDYSDTYLVPRLGSFIHPPSAHGIDYLPAETVRPLPGGAARAEAPPAMPGPSRPSRRPRRIDTARKRGPSGTPLPLTPESIEEGPGDVVAQKRRGRGQTGCGGGGGRDKVTSSIPNPPSTLQPIVDQPIDPPLVTQPEDRPAESNGAARANGGGRDEQSIEALAATMTKLDAEVARLGREAVRREEENAQLVRTLERLERENIRREEENARLQRDLDQLKTDQDTLRAVPETLAELRSDVDRLTRLSSPPSPASDYSA